jgi:transposase
MIVIGTDPHKASHTAAALDADRAEPLDELTVRARAEGHECLLGWARELDDERVWALEDCRHVSGGFERFLLRSGERVGRVPPKLMAGARKGAREFGKSDPLAAEAVARAAIREGIDALPRAHLAGGEREIALLLDHREDLVAERTRIQQRLRWLLHDLDPDIEVPERALEREKWLRRLAGRLARREQSAPVRILRAQVRRCRELTREANALERELTALVRRQAPQLLALPGCGPLTAAKLIAEVAGVERFGTDAELAMLAGVAPLDASSGKQQRHRLNRTGNRQLNLALHRIALTQSRLHAPAKQYLVRRQSEGKTKREALRALKRYLARRVFRILTLIANRMKHPNRIEISTAPRVRCLT